MQQEGADASEPSSLLLSMGGFRSPCFFGLYPEEPSPRAMAEEPGMSASGGEEAGSRGGGGGGAGWGEVLAPVTEVAEWQRVCDWLDGLGLRRLIPLFRHQARPPPHHSSLTCLAACLSHDDRRMVWGVACRA